ncbi:MAG TPA: beta-phosphoglucomutase family hydrolase [Chitinophagaceae bacterium]|nr:beta-phosphoglucomutase family hydrolase [Chitinophagaceae bacterium]
MKWKAFLFDLNGTMINDMPYHVKAWHGILNQLGSDISMEEMKAECYGKNHELLERIFPGRFTDAEKNELSWKKEEQYREDFLPSLKLLPGLKKFITDAHAAGIKMAIGSAAIMSNIDFVLDGTGIRQYFDAIVSADNVRNSKPHPETFLACAEQLNVSPHECLVFEDAPAGVKSAANAGMDAVVITGHHETEEFNGQSNIISFITDYNGLFEQLIP